MAGQHEKECIFCETTCEKCKDKLKPQFHRDMTTRHYNDKEIRNSEFITIPRAIVEKAINLCPDDNFRKLIGEYL